MFSSAPVYVPTATKTFEVKVKLRDFVALFRFREHVATI